MAHVKAGSSSANQKSNVAGKRRGLKVNQGQVVNGGQILVRQTGVLYHPGANTKLARDHSVISLVVGTVAFSYLRRPNGLRTVINVYPEGQSKPVSIVKEKASAAKAVKAPKAEKVETEAVAEVKEEKKVAAKTPKKVVKAAK